MNNGLIAICDEDSDYANSLAAYFRLKGSLASEIIVFTEYETFSRYIKDCYIDILIMQEDFTDSIKNLSHNNLFILCDTLHRENLDDVHKIYKYNSAEEILRIIMANYDTSQPTSLLSFHKYRKSKLIGIASPIGRCGKTSLALGLALKLSQDHSCLFISFDECLPLRIFLPQKDSIRSSLADIIYYFLQNMDISDNRILSCFQTFQGMDYIPPSDQLGTYSELQSEELLNFILNISGLGRYDYIVVDWGTFSFDYSLLKTCNSLLLPTLDNDLYSSEKTKCFFETIKHQYKEDPLFIKSLMLPYINFNQASSEYTFSLTSGTLGNLITSLIQELNL